jgi:hypothetical protein
VGQGDYVVKHGDCISSIAIAHGFFWDTIWNLPENAGLKEARGDPNVLLVGDRVFIPEKRKRLETRPTEAKHSFVMKGVPARVRLQLLDEDEPRVNEDYVLIVDGTPFEGATDAEGILEQVVPPNARKATLRIGTAEEGEEYELSLGGLDPIDEISGIQMRLANLAFECGAPDGTLNEETQYALREFQRRYKLEETGEPDDGTRQELKKIHGS